MAYGTPPSLDTLSPINLSAQYPHAISIKIRSSDANYSSRGTSPHPAWPRLRPHLILIIAALLVAVILGCTSDVEPTPYDRDLFTPITGPPPSPIIFAGKFTVAGEPGPADQTIYAEFIHGGSGNSTTLEGEYVQLILGPVSVDDIEHGVIGFYLGTRDGDHVKADQTWEWSAVAQPTNQVLDLSFPHLPDS